MPIGLAHPPKGSRRTREAKGRGWPLAAGRYANIENGTATVSLRKESTRRTRHELTHLPTVLNRVDATVSLDLSKEQTAALAPPIGATGKQRRNNIIGDVRLCRCGESVYPCRALIGFWCAFTTGLGARLPLRWMRGVPSPP